jgi:hypothetical protein
MELEEGLSQESFISPLVEPVKEKQRLHVNFFPLHNYDHSLIPVAETTSRFVQNCGQVYVVEQPFEIHEQTGVRMKRFGTSNLMFMREIQRWKARKNFEKMRTLEKLQRMEKQKKLQREEEVQQKNTQYLGFLLGVVVLFICQYLMGYVEKGQWNTYSNGAWEFRATYVCIELRLGSYPFQKFRERPGRFSGVTERSYSTKTGVTVKYKPWVWFKKSIFYFKAQKTAEKAAKIRDVAKFWFKIEGRDLLNFGEKDYD